MTMRFTCEKNLLVQGLNIAGRAVAQKSSLSVIEGILCCAGLGISLTGYNMETAITISLEADVTDAGCPDKLCVRMGAVSRAGQSIVCLPGGIVVTVVGGTPAVDGEV